MRLRPAADGDLPALAALEAEVFPDAPWSAAQLADQLARRGGITLIALSDDGDVAGGAWGWAAGGVSELLRVAVHADARRRGLGRTLVQALAEAATEAGAEELWLEVRADNHGARRLYEGLGMQVTGRRTGYYDDGADAVLMGVALPLVGAG